MTLPRGGFIFTATCEVWTNPAGLELRLTMGGHGMPMTTVVSSFGEALRLLEQWKAAMMENGWS